MSKQEVRRSPPPMLGSKANLSPHWYYGILFLIVLFFAGLRWRLRDMPLERDEGEYAYAGQLILQGIPPYKLAYNMKLPGTYAAYALILASLGESPASIHMGLSLINAGTILIIYLLAARLFDRRAGVVAAASYALLSTSPSVMGFAGHATHFVVAAASSGVLLLLRAIEHKKLQLLFLSGFLLGIAFLMKQPGIFFALLGFIYLLRSEWRRPIDWRNLALRITSFSVGICVPVAVTCIALYRAGVFREFWFWTFSYAREYGSRQSLGEGLENLMNTAPRVIGASIWIWIMAGAGLTSLLWSRKAMGHSAFLALFAACSFLAVCPGLYFREHYFILLLPAISLFAGIGVSCATELLCEMRAAKTLALLLLIVFLTSFAYSLFRERTFLFQLNPVAACRQIYGANPFPEALKIADYLRTQMPGKATLAVLGSEPEIYFYSGRHSATGYIYIYGLMEEQQYAFSMQKEMIHQVETAQPEFLVYVDVPTSWLAQAGSPQQLLFLSWAQKYIQEEYRLDGIVDIFADETQYRWGRDAATYQPHSEFTVRVFKRRES